MSEHACSNGDADQEWIETKATVVALEADWAILQPASQGCGRCHEPGGCGGQSLTQMLSPNKNYRVHNAIHAKVGDRVLVQGHPSLVQQAAWQAYVQPLIALLLGAGVGQWVGQDQGAMLGGLGGLLLGWLQLASRRRVANNDVALQMRHDLA